jgi:hypothetical protein
LKWLCWALVAAALVFTVFVSSFLVLAFRANANLDYVVLFLLSGVVLNLFFGDKKLMYLSTISMPVLSVFIMPDLFPAAMAVCVAVVWGALCITLGAIRDRL